MTRLTANLPFGVMIKFEEILQRPVSKDNDWFISIYPDETYGRIQTPIVENTHYAMFWDDVDPKHPLNFNDDQARSMAEFIRMVKAKDGNLWVNCIAGISRSGAVVETLIRLGWKDYEHWNQETRYPNPLVFQRLTKHFPELMMPTPPMSAQTWNRLLGTPRTVGYTNFDN